MTIRVTRVLQYEYPDMETMQRDQERWTLQAPTASPVKMRQIGWLIDTPEPETPADAIDGECDVRTVAEWEAEFGMRVLDPDGWRAAHIEFDLAEQMTANRFLGLTQNSTLSGLNNWSHAKARIV